MTETLPCVSLRILARPGELDCVLEQILNIDGARIQSTSDAGELHVVVEAGDREELYRRIDILQFVEGLESSTLRYH